MASTGAVRRTRGPNRQAPWVRSPEAGVSVLRLALDTTDPMQRRRIESMFSAAFSIRRAVQGDARSRARAYRAATRERERDPAAARTRLGLSREALERCAYGHLDAAPHLRRSVTKSLAMHLADTVWTATERHLFRDASGKTLGMPGPGRWHDFVRLPGRARSHTKQRKWETFRLHGTLAGHRAAYTGADGRFAQPRRMRGVVSAAESWWGHDGPLAIVFTGLPDGPLVLPVRLPAAPSNQPILDHHLADPDRWHKIDLVRRQDPNAAGGWRYEAHLMVLTQAYAAPAVVARRTVAATDTAGRTAGIDVNVSNLTVASHDRGRDLRITRVARDAGERERGRRRARHDRRRLRQLERSRRAENPEQYELSRRQQERARRHTDAGLPPPQVIPSGPRRLRGDGKPARSFRKDRLSRAYRRGRAAQVAASASASRARRDHARRIAGAIVGEHGCRLTVEDCDLRTWARRWGRSLAAFSPATLLAAIEREAEAVARVAGGPGGLARASTHTTALSQHCLCGQRVDKPLGQRVHTCPSCELRGDRDAVAAVLAAFVVFTRPGDPASARVDVDAAHAAAHDPHARRSLHDTLAYQIQGRQDAPSESNARSARDGWSAAERSAHPTWSRWLGEALARRRTQPRMSLAFHGQTTPERMRTRTNLSRTGGLPPLRDSS